MITKLEFEYQFMSKAKIKESSWRIKPDSQGILDHDNQFKEERLIKRKLASYHSSLTK